MSAAESTPDTIRLRAEGRVARRQAWSRASRWILLIATVLGLVVLVILGIDNAITGIPSLDWDFLSNYPSRFAERAGIRSSILGSVWVLVFTVVFAIPVAVGAAVWMEEFAPRTPSSPPSASTSPTSRVCPASSTASSAWPCSFASWSSARASSPAPSRLP